jgi:DNA-binding MarR family transcriptional regulator
LKKSSRRRRSQAPAGALIRNRLRLDDFLPYRLSVLSNTVSGAIAGAYAQEFGLSILEWRVLTVLALEPGLSAGQVADRTAMDKVAVSRAVTRLLRSRRIAREFANADRRRSVLRLTRDGERVYGRVVPLARNYERALLARLSPGRRRQLQSLLRDLLDRAHALGPVRPA